MGKEITITTRYSFNDFIYPVKHKILGSWGTWVVILIAFLLLASDIFYLFNKSIFPNGELPIYNIVLPIVVFIVFPFSIYFGLKKSYNNNHVIKEETKVTYTKDGINTIGETHQSFTEWSRVKSIKEYKEFFTLKINGVETYLPKSFFVENKLDDFRGLIKELDYLK